MVGWQGRRAKGSEGKGVRKETEGKKENEGKRRKGSKESMTKGLEQKNEKKGGKTKEGLFYFV